MRRFVRWLLCAFAICEASFALAHHSVAFYSNDKIESPYALEITQVGGEAPAASGQKAPAASDTAAASANATAPVQAPTTAGGSTASSSRR